MFNVFWVIIGIFSRFSEKPPMLTHQGLQSDLYFFFDEVQPKRTWLSFFKHTVELAYLSRDQCLYLL